MAALPAGVQYGLSSESTNKENKELVFVKLTDSALKAIEDFIRNNRDKLAKPTIQFLPGNEGKISIPAPATSNGPTSEATFHFSINSNAEMEGPQGSFECVKSGGARRLESCGPLPRRMRVQANDDSYEATKDRMARTVAAEQSKCTRVIKPNQTDIGRRVKVRSSHPLYSSGPAATLERTERPERAERAERPDRPERPDRAERPERAERPPVPVPRAQPPPAPHQPHHPHQPHQLHQPSQPPPHPHQQQRPPTNPDLTRRSIKERLIQLLALKPFKKPELYLRLNQEGIKERERSLVNKILPQIGSLKDNCYHLRRHMWNDVNEDWPFYSEEEKRMLKRRKPQNLTPPVSSDSTNSLSPRASPGGKRPSAVSGVVIAPSADAVEPPASKKQRISHYRRPSPPSSGYATGSSGASSGERHASDNEDDRTNGQYPPTNPLSPRASPGGKRPVLESVEPVAAKKQRVSHCRRPSPQSSGYGTGSSGASSGERHASDNEDERTIVKKDNGYTLNFNTVKEICPSPVKTNGFRSSSPPAEQPSITDTHNITTNTETLENADLTSVPEENVTDLEEIERQYPPITSASTRRAYKNEFAELYTEYQSMYERVAQVAALFTRLEQQLKRAPPHSPHHQSIEQRIVDEYRRVRNDATYQAEKSRVNYLHRKLTHIKRMVQHYDQLRNLKSERVSTASTTQAY